MSQLVTILSGIAILVGAALVLAIAKGIAKIVENTATVARLAKAMDDHMTEKDGYRAEIRETLIRHDERISQAERRLDHLGS